MHIFCIFVYALFMHQGFTWNKGIRIRRDKECHVFPEFKASVMKWIEGSNFSGDFVWEIKIIPQPCDAKTIFWQYP